MFSPMIDLVKLLVYDFLVYAVSVVIVVGLIVAGLKANQLLEQWAEGL